MFTRYASRVKPNCHACMGYPVTQEKLFCRINLSRFPGRVDNMRAFDIILVFLAILSLPEAIFAGSEEICQYKNAESFFLLGKDWLPCSNCPSTPSCFACCSTGKNCSVTNTSDLSVRVRNLVELLHSPEFKCNISLWSYL